MAFSYPKIIGAAQRSGLPYRVISTYRPGARTKTTNKVSHHARGDAVDFGGFSQDALAAYYLGLPHYEVFHKSLETGIWYGSSNGNPVNEATHPELVKEHEDHLHVAASNEHMAGMPVSNPILGAASKAIDAVTAPAETAISMANAWRSFATVGANLANPFMWRRVGMGVIGATLIIIGLLYLNRRAISDTAGKVTGAVTGLAGTAAQGAAFGVGAGATGALGGGKPKSAPPSPPGPYPPRKALPSNAPVTSVLPEAYAPVSPGGTYQVTAVGRAKRPSAPLPGHGTPVKKKEKGAGTQSLFTPSVNMKDVGKKKG